MSLKNLMTLPHLPFRLVVILGPLFMINRAVRMSSLPGLPYNLWGLSDVSFFTTLAILLSVIFLSLLLFSRHYLIAVLLTGSLLYVHLMLNPHFYWGWGQITPVIILCWLGAQKLKNPAARSFFKHAFVFYVLAIYLVPCLDRFAYEDWFTGRVVSVLLASQDFARFPVLIQDYRFFAPLSTLMQFTELLGPLIYIFIPGTRKIIPTIMIAFHASLMIVSDIEMWHPFMAFLWWELRKNPPEFSLKAKLLVLAGLISIIPISIIVPEKLHVAYMNSFPMRILSDYRVIPFSRMRMFTSDEIFIKRTTMNYINGEFNQNLSATLQPYFLRRYFGFRAKTAAPLEGLCQRSGDLVSLIYEAEGIEENYHQKRDVICK